MKIVDLLMSYKHFSFLEPLLECSKVDAKSYVKLTEQHINGKRCFCVQSQPSLNELTGSVLSSIVIDTRLHLVKAECGCLKFYRNKECIHTTILLALAIKIIDEDIFNRIMKKYNEYQDKTILVTGGAGCVGSNLTRKFADLGAEKVIILDNLSSAYEWNISPRDNIEFIQFFKPHDG